MAASSVDRASQAPWVVQELSQPLSSFAPPPGVPETRAAVARALQRKLVRLAGSMRKLDLRRFEGRSAEACRRELLPRLLSALDAALVLTEEIQARLAPESGLDESGVLELEMLAGASLEQAAGADSRAAAAEAAGVAFVARLEVRSRRERVVVLSATEQRDALLDAAASAQRQVWRSSEALEEALHALSGVPTRLKEEGLLAQALETRRQYAALRDAIRASAPPDETSVWPRLAAVGERLAELRALPVYGHFRLADRRQMEQLEARIRPLLRQRSDIRAALRLWQDLLGFGDLIAQVSARQELMAHDGTLAVELLRWLEQGGEDVTVRTLVERTRELRGASPDVDALLSERSGDRDAWRSALEEVARRCSASCA